jgi:diacylglycerol kinase (ATP)
MADRAAEAARRVRQVAVVLNPAAGRGQGARQRAELERRLTDVAEYLSHFDDVPPAQWRILETTAPGRGSVLAADAAAQGADVVAAAGGDGTCGEVVNGLVGTGARFGILPLGTGNDFARCLGLGTDLERAVETLFCGASKPVDLGCVQGRWFLNIAGCGFDAVVAERVNRGFRALRGTAAYLAAVYQSLRDFRPAAMRLTLDGETRELRAMLCAICNATHYGGGMRIAPGARLDDGQFDICLLSEAGKMEFLAAFPRVFRGTHVTHPKVTMLRARQVVVESDPPMPILVDGDVIGTTPAEFTIAPRALEVMAPPPVRAPDR